MEIYVFILILMTFWVFYERFNEFLWDKIESIKFRPKSDKTKKKTHPSDISVTELIDNIVNDCIGTKDNLGKKDDLKKFITDAYFAYFNEWKKLYDTIDKDPNNNDEFNKLDSLLEKKDAIFTKGLERIQIRKRLLLQFYDTSYFWFYFCKRISIFLFAFVIGVAVCFCINLSFLSITIEQTSYVIPKGLIFVDKLILTPILFAGGPDLFHQLISLIQSIKERSKAEKANLEKIFR